MIAMDMLADGLLAAVAGVGFGAVSHPPRRAFPFIALLAAVGHATRFALMSYAHADIALSSFLAALIVGFGSLWLGRPACCPMTVLFIPALLPMIPGMYAYKCVFAWVMFVQNLNRPELVDQYMQAIFTNATITISVVFLLAVGASVPILIFHSRAYSLTRKKK